MNTSSKYRQVPDLLLGCTIFASCFLLSGCDFLSSLFCPKQEPHYPSTVLLVKKNDVDETTKTTHFVFDWNKIRIGDDPLITLIPKPKYWRVTLFSYEDPSKLIADTTPIEYSKTTNTDLQKLPLDYLMRADLDLIYEGTPENPSNFKSVPFVVLLHKFPEKD